MARKGITPSGREKLIVALQLDEVLHELNTALRVRKAQLVLDYTGVQPMLNIGMPGTKFQTWLVGDLRSKRCFGFWPAHPDLNAIVHDITARLAKHNAWLAVCAEKQPNRKPVTKLQVFFQESKYTAITLITAQKGQFQARHELLPPRLVTT